MRNLCHSLGNAGYRRESPAAVRPFVMRLAAGVLMLGLAGCGHAPPTPKAFKLPKVPAGKSFKFWLQVNVADNANGNSPLPVDFVMVSEKKLLPEIAKLSAKDWFERRVQLTRDFPTQVKVVSWEWVPGYHVGPITIEVMGGTKAGFFFANYSNAGEHRAYADMRTPVVLNLGVEEFSVQPLK